MPRGVYNRPSKEPAVQIDNESQLAGLQAGQQRMEQRASEAAAAQAAAVSESADGQPVKLSRQNRKPFGTMEQKLYWPKREGYHRHWFNDTPGRIEAAIGAGYAHVTDSATKNVSRVVGKTDGGQAMRAFLMEIPEEWFQEDMARAQEVVDQVRNDIYRGEVGPLRQSERHRPARGINIKESR